MPSLYYLDPQRRAHPAFLAGKGLQHGQGTGDPLPITDLEETAPGGLLAGDLDLTTSPSGLLHRGLAPP